MVSLNKIFFRFSNTGTLILSLILFLLLSLPTHGQQYGLRFSGAEVPQYQRTTLDLYPEGFFSLRNEFTLSFDFSFPPDLHRYYGYIIRIIDDKDTNIDLVFNYRDYATTALTVIHQNEQTNIFLKTNLVEMFDSWQTIALAFDLKNNQLTLTMGDTSLVAQNIVLNNRLKILFGGNDYKQFKAIDVPPMIIRDIKISEGNRLLHHWPLNESNGNSENDLIRNRRAQIQNPTWIRRLYQNWENLYNDSIDGRVAVTYSNKDQMIYFVGQNMMRIYNPSVRGAESLYYTDLPQNNIQGRRAFFDTLRNRLVLFSIWNTTFSSFNFDSLSWSNIYTGPTNPTLIWHFNKHFSETDNSLMVFGGYGQYEFRNIVHHFSLSSNEYNTLKTTGDKYHPRYLSALGVVEDTVFILGGRGSISGKQIESPTNFHDLIAFCLKTKEFTKRYDFTPPIEDAVFANSLVMDETNGSFYALAFSNYLFHSSLQLVRGNLYEPHFELLGDKIPFKFEDILSFSDLYYCKSTNKLIAVTLFYNSDLDKTNFSVYTISFPPEEFIEKTDKARNVFLSKWNILVLLVLGGVLLFFITALWVRKYKKSSAVSQEQKGYEKIKNELEVLPGKEAAEINNITTDTKEVTYKNTILFFGGFKIFNNESEDITNKFSPLLKEIFLLVWLNSMKGYNGISSEKLKELFWFHKDDKKAMNNRAVNIAKLKSLLEELDECNLSRETGYWKIEFNERVVYNDYLACLKLADNKKVLQKNDINKLINIINKGSFLEDLSYEWLDKFKADISNLMIDTLVEFGLSYEIKQDPDFILHLADTIFKFDIVNEEAMGLKCKALIAVGKHSMAKKCYTEFLKNYKELYDNDFEESYSEIIK